MAIPFDSSASFARAAQIAEAQEEEARRLLWGRINEKAAANHDFRRQLSENPRKTVEAEAKRLEIETGKEAAVDSAVLDKVSDEVREKFSSAVPDVEAARVEGLIFGTIEDIKRSFNVSLQLSQVLFYSGLAITVVAFAVGLYTGEKLLSLLFGAGGIGTALISSLVLSPLDRVQNAAGNLVQLQMAYLAYYKQLHLLGGAREVRSREDAVAYAHEIDRAAVSLIKSIQTYIEKDGTSAPPGSRVRIPKHIKPDSTSTTASRPRP